MEKKNLTQLKLYENQIEKGKIELENKKNQFITEIKKLDKNQIIPKKEKKLTIWQRIKKVLMG